MNRLSWQTEDYDYTGDYVGWLCRLTTINKQEHPWYIVFTSGDSSRLFGGWMCEDPQSAIWYSGQKHPGSFSLEDPDIVTFRDRVNYLVKYKVERIKKIEHWTDTLD